MNEQEAKNWVSSQKWVFAKSYSKTFPHCYTTRDRCISIPDFESFLRHIREYGKLKSFFKKQYIYLEIDGLEYWEMGRPIPAVQVLNRAPIDDAARYRNPLPVMGSEELIKDKLSKREDYLHGLLKKTSLTTKEQKQLAFLMNNQRRIHGGGKNILDHSSLEVRYE
jgi:hypothetical protein